MSRVIIKNGIGYGKSTQAAFVTDEKPFTKVGDTLADSNDSNEWALWGTNNLEPKLLKTDIKGVPSLSGTIHSKVRMAIGTGLEAFLLEDVDSESNETLTYLKDTEIQQWLERNKTYKYSLATIYNLLSYGPAATQLIFNNELNYINRIKATDIFTARFKKKNKEGFIDTMYLHADWENVTGAGDSTLKKVPVLKEDYEVEELKEQIEKKTVKGEYAMLHRIVTDGTQYYPDPLWKSAQAWAKIAASVPAFKKAMNANQMSIKYLILISNKFWETSYPWQSYTQEQKDQAIEAKYDEINEWLVGETNAGKTIIAGNWYDPHTKQSIPDITIEVIDDKFKDGKYLPDGAIADKQIMFALMYNPAIGGANLFGDGASGGGGSGSDIREAFFVQLMMMHAERILNLEVFNVVKHINGWADKYEKDGKLLVFRYKTGVLTTLDSGGSTKPTTT